MDTTAPETRTNQPFELEAVEIELSLDPQSIEKDGFETAMRRAVESAGAVLLFHMAAQDDDDEAKWIAAVAFGDGGENELAIVTLTADGASSIEPVAQSKAPIAAIAPAFAGLAHSWAPAA